MNRCSGTIFLRRYHISSRRWQFSTSKATTQNLHLPVVARGLLPSTLFLSPANPANTCEKYPRCLPRLFPVLAVYHWISIVPCIVCDHTSFRIPNLDHRRSSILRGNRTHNLDVARWTTAPPGYLKSHYQPCRPLVASPNLRVSTYSFPTEI